MSAALFVYVFTLTHYSTEEERARPRVLQTRSSALLASILVGAVLTSGQLEAPLGLAPAAVWISLVALGGAVIRPAWLRKPKPGLVTFRALRALFARGGCACLADYDAC